MADVEPLNVFFVILLVMMSGLFSGLTLGLMGLDLTGLDIVMAAGTDDERRHAKKILPVRQDGNLLLCTLLLGNVAVNAALSILLADMTDGLVGFLSSTIVIVLFGEILPQAICSRHPLAVGANTVWLVRIIMMALYVVTKPLALALDWILGKEMGTIYTKNEFKKLVQLHSEAKGLEKDEAKIMAGALDLGVRTVSTKMRPIDEVYMLEEHVQLDFQTLTDIFKSGYSRIPVYNKELPHNPITGLLIVKDLILLDPADSTPLQTIINFYGREIPKVFPDCSLKALLDIFKGGKSHMAIVHDVDNSGPGDPFYKTVGVVTLEDVIESILQQDILDETDQTDHGAERKNLASLFDRRRRLPNTITPQEASAIFFHLTGTVDIFKQPDSRVSEAALKQLIMESDIEEVAVDDRKHKDPAWVYRRGEASEHFTLVLDGRLEILAGRAQFPSVVTRWSVLCEDMLAEVPTPDADETHPPDMPPYIPDFSARPTENCRLLRISRQGFWRACANPSVAPRRQSSFFRRIETPSEDDARDGVVVDVEGTGVDEPDPVAVMRQMREANHVP